MILDKWRDSPEKWIPRRTWSHASLAELLQDTGRGLIGMRFQAKSLVQRCEFNAWASSGRPPGEMPAILLEATTALRTAPHDDGRSKHDLHVRVFVPQPNDLDAWLNVEVSGSFRAVWGVIPDIHKTMTYLAQSGYTVQVSNPWAR